MKFALGFQHTVDWDPVTRRVVDRAAVPPEDRSRIQTCQTVAGRAVELWHRAARARLKQLLDLNAPAVLVCRACAPFESAYDGRLLLSAVPVASRPQLALLDLWKDEPVLKEVARGKANRCFVFRTPKGAIQWKAGRWGWFWEVLDTWKYEDVDS